MLQTRKLPNGTTDVRCTLCGYSEAVIDLSSYRCFCPHPAVEASHLQERPILENVEKVEETPKPKRRRRKKPVATES